MFYIVALLGAFLTGVIIAIIYKKITCKIVGPDSSEIRKYVYKDPVTGKYYKFDIDIVAGIVHRYSLR